LEKYSIKVNILNRPYPLLVRAEEEEAVRNAARLINEKIRVYKEKFSVKDEQDLVIMCCLELATDNMNQARLQKERTSKLEEGLTLASDLLSSAILNVEETAA